MLTGGRRGEGGASGGSTTGGGTAAEECERDDDCFLANDCCSCESLPAGAQGWECPESCPAPRCGGIEIDEEAVQCVGGQCVLDRDCDPDAVTCDEVEPSCAADEVAFVQDGCWGACILAVDCSAGTS
jgi:hypothetical protein